MALCVPGQHQICLLPSILLKLRGASGERKIRGSSQSSFTSFPLTSSTPPLSLPLPVPSPLPAPRLPARLDQQAPEPEHQRQEGTGATCENHTRERREQPFPRVRSPIPHNGHIPPPFFNLLISPPHPLSASIWCTRTLHSVTRVALDYFGLGSRLPAYGTRTCAFFESCDRKQRFKTRKRRRGGGEH